MGSGSPDLSLWATTVRVGFYLFAIRLLATQQRSAWYREDLAYAFVELVKRFQSFEALWQGSSEFALHVLYPSWYNHCSGGGNSRRKIHQRGGKL